MERTVDKMTNRINLAYRAIKAQSNVRFRIFVKIKIGKSMAIATGRKPPRYIVEAHHETN